MEIPTTDQTVYYIYGLVDPETEDIRYVGCSKNPHTRLHVHFSMAMRNSRGNVGLETWIRNVANKGNRPRIVILDTAYKDNRLEKEKLWIEQMLQKGQPILNRYLSGPGKLESIPSYTRTPSKKLSVLIKEYR